MPMHKGHLYCIDTAARQCDHVTVIMFVGGNDEMHIRQTDSDPLLQVESRFRQVQRVCQYYDNVECHLVDVSKLKYPDGSEDWDAETPLVRQFVPKMDFVYSSEPSYDAYFKRAYPEAVHVIVDEKRTAFPISGTMIRAMQTIKEKEKWMV